MSYDTEGLSLLHGEIYAYHKGFLKPHYPVPATLVQTAFNNFHDNNHWWHWEWTKRRIFHDRDWE